MRDGNFMGGGPATNFGPIPRHSRRNKPFALRNFVRAGRTIGESTLSSPRESGDAKEFVERMALFDRKVASIMNPKNQRGIERLNQGRRPFPRLDVGDRAWVKRPEGSGTKLASRWIGPGLVVDQKGANSYKVEIERIDSLKCQPNFSSHFWRMPSLDLGPPVLVQAHGG